MNRSIRHALHHDSLRNDFLAAARGALLAAAALCLCVSSSFAEPSKLGLRPSQTASAEPSGTPDAQTESESEPIDWSVLNWDASKLSVSGAHWSSTARKALPTGWETKAGIDNKGADQNTDWRTVDPEKLLPGAHASSAAAWASVTAPSLDAPVGWDKATIDARFDPLNEERKFGTTFSKSVPLNDRFSVTLQNGYSVMQSDPAVHLPGATQSFSSDNAAKFNVLPTGTSLSLGTVMSTTDDKWLNRIGAEQKLFDGISVKGSVSETPTGIPDRSISAGFKRSW